MERHYKIIGGLLLLVATAFIAAVLWSHMELAVAILIMGSMLLGIIAIAYMRPTGRSPERHANVDQIVRDVEP